VVVGRTVTIVELLEEGIRRGLQWDWCGPAAVHELPGEHLDGVYSANEFLTRISLMKACKFPVYDEPMLDVNGKSVAVIGGGNTALDATRSALQLGAGKACAIYRRSERRTRPAGGQRLPDADSAGGVRL
jgi:glutamate synthase (NADPH/NADH) small chain